MTKQQQRQIIRERMAQLSQAEKLSFSRRICERLLRLPQLEDARVIMSYLATDREADVDQFNRIMASRGIVVCYPVIRGDDMQAYYSPQEEYALNGYGIREPQRTSGILMDREAIDLVIVPCLAFDGQLNRLGHGKGFYDRFLRGLSVCKVAVGFEAQKLESIETSEHDVRMNMVITEERTYRNIELLP